MATVGERVRQLRKAKGLTQPILAKAIGIDQSTLSDIERGARFGAETLMCLAEALGTTCEYLMRGRVQESEEMRKVQQAIKALSDEQRLALYSAWFDLEAPRQTPDEVLRAARVPPPPRRKKLA